VRLWQILTGQNAAQVTSVERWLFLLTVFFAAGLIWLVPYPPLTDFPQHVGQVSVARDVLLGRSPWAAELQLNWVTPYLALYLPALLLAFVLPALIAVKLVITAGFLFYIAIALRFVRAFGGPDSCRWLLLPGYFGFAWHYGMVTFLMAVPFGLLLIMQAGKATQRPSGAQQARVLLIACLTFFSHILVFLLAALSGALLAVLSSRLKLRAMTVQLWPYLLMAGLLVSYIILGVGSAPQPEAQVLIWDADPRDRLAWLAQGLTSVEPHAGLKYLGALLLAFPLLLARARAVSLRTALPLLSLLLIWFTLPAFAMSTGFFYQRFAVFLLPFYLPLFTQSRPVGFYKHLAHGFMVLSCVASLVLTALATLAFARESADFAAVQAVLEQRPPARILSLAAGTRSAAAHSEHVYTHYAVWLQAEGPHWVEFNFAVFRPQLLRYRGELPAVQRTSQSAPAENQIAFDWAEYEGARYDYFVVFSARPVSEALFANPDCQVKFLHNQGRWWVFEKTVCR
jgi:hypothetical protein